MIYISMARDRTTKMLQVKQETPTNLSFFVALLLLLGFYFFYLKNCHAMDSTRYRFS